MKPRPLLLAAAMAVALLATGCRSFESRWSEAGRTAPPAGDITGRWTGSWQNTNNTHGGALRAVILPAGDDGREYLARFHATWGGRSGGFKSRLRGHWDGSTFRFTSRRRILGVLITTGGEADGRRFHARYGSPFDVGTFTLERPPGGQ